jgi:hypothetical protein
MLNKILSADFTKDLTGRLSVHHVASMSTGCIAAGDPAERAI